MGCSNAHQAIELYIKAILSLNNNEKAEKWHDLVKLLKTYKSRDPYFSTLLGDSHKVEFLNELTAGYFDHRYGDAGSNSNLSEIIALLDDLAFNLRNIYLRRIKVTTKICIPEKLKEEFLSTNAKFSEDDLNTTNKGVLLGLTLP